MSDEIKVLIVGGCGVNGATIRAMIEEALDELTRQMANDAISRQMSASMHSPIIVACECDQHDLGVTSIPQDMLHEIIIQPIERFDFESFITVVDEDLRRPKKYNRKIGSRRESRSKRGSVDTVNRKLRGKSRAIPCRNNVRKMLKR
ncbi:hypothetical protein ACFL3M_01740 [Patescibacteria group bacterium]